MNLAVAEALSPNKTITMDESVSKVRVTFYGVSQHYTGYMGNRPVFKGWEYFRRMGPSDLLSLVMVMVMVMDGSISNVPSFLGVSPHYMSEGTILLLITEVLPVT